MTFARDEFAGEARIFMLEAAPLRAKGSYPLVRWNWARRIGSDGANVPSRSATESNCWPAVT